MKVIIQITLFLGLSLKIFGQKNELIIIGNVHSPMENYNADSLYNILDKIKPEIILHEIDSTFFTSDFKFNSPSKGNEQTASTKYLEKYPSTLLRPFDFEGRDRYRKEKGIKQSENLAMQLLDSLYKNEKLNKDQYRIVVEYNRLTDLLNTFGFKFFAQNFNNYNTDSIARVRQYYQHYEIRKVINQREEFSKIFVTTTTNEKITLCEGYNRFCDFWDLRNKTMAKNILSTVKNNPNKRIVVLTGYYHRYYLIEELQKEQNSYFILREFYEYQ